MTERDNFNAVLKQVLKVSKTEIQRRLDAEKAAKPSASRVPAAPGAKAQKAVCPSLPVNSL